MDTSSELFRSKELFFQKNLDQGVLRRQKIRGTSACARFFDALIDTASGLDTRVIICKFCMKTYKGTGRRKARFLHYLLGKSSEKILKEFVLFIDVYMNMFVSCSPKTWKFLGYFWRAFKEKL